MNSRRSGILLHATSLPSPYGIGDFGPDARRFVDFLENAGQSVWQVLPFSPSSSACGNSPYCSFSAFAGNPLLISPALLVEDGYIEESDAARHPGFRPDAVDFDAVNAFKTALLAKAFDALRFKGIQDCGFTEFCGDNAAWLDDYSLFVCLKEVFNGVAWTDWPKDVRDRQPEAMASWLGKLEEKVLGAKFVQYVFYRQWRELKKYCNEKSIQIIGDVPIYVSQDSADVWAHPEFFKLDENRMPRLMAGVPPDYFSATGQLWGNPVYDWDRLSSEGFSWWLQRMQHNLETFDMVRLDHFRGFIAYWEVPAGEKTAIGGRWVEAPAREFFDALQKRFPSLPIIAEDLGTITADVRSVMKAYGFPGMKLLHFAFSGDVTENPYVPHNHVVDSLVYTGTHDNNTTRGWFRSDATADEKENLARYIGRRINEDQVTNELIRMAMMSVSSTAVIQMQDVLDLGEDARMNVPSVGFGNWKWRLESSRLTPDLTQFWAEMTRVYGRGSALFQKRATPGS